MQTIKEGSAAFLTFSFLDELGVPVIPGTIDWRLDDVSNAAEIIDWTPVVVPAASVTATIPGANNAIVNQARVFENRVVTVRINVGQPNQGLQKKNYRIENLHGAP